MSVRLPIDKKAHEGALLFREASKKFGSNGHDCKYPSGAFIANNINNDQFNPNRLARVTTKVEMPIAEFTSKFGPYGPVVISILEDHEELLFNFLSTIEQFFKLDSPGHSFLAGSNVYVAWGTSPQDLEEAHKKIVRDLKAQGCDTERINFLNILDYNTNIREANDNIMAAAQAQGEQGGLQALKYLAQYYRNNPCAASLLQTSKPSDVIQDENATTLANTQPALCYVHKDGSPLHTPRNWDPAEQPINHNPVTIQIGLEDIWSKQPEERFQVPVLNKLLWKQDVNSLFDLKVALNTRNESLIRVLKAFNQFVMNNKWRSQ